jgi:pSer/pThr/pTyr-binding forkhead associated (FHA) protein
MIKCPFCHTSHVDNTVFCSECGNYLLEEGDKRATDPFGTDEINLRGYTFGDAGTAQSLQQGTGPMTLRLKIGDNQREVQVVLNRVIHLGRLDPTSNIFPEVDLTPDGVSARGVSRRHVSIFKQGVGVVVEDLGSVNGTFVNGKRLDPYLPEPLQDGDTLQLGKLLIKVILRGQ